MTATVIWLAINSLLCFHRKKTPIPADKPHKNWQSLGFDELVNRFLYALRKIRFTALY